jgi:hypothetical protein
VKKCGHRAPLLSIAPKDLLVGAHTDELKLHLEVPTICKALSSISRTAKRGWGEYVTSYAGGKFESLFSFLDYKYFLKGKWSRIV